MAEDRVQRRLAAILAADMVGYSRLIGADEEGTIARQKAHRAELIDLEIANHGGRIVKTMGDGLLVEFPSVVDSVKCAIAVQQAMSEREANVPEERRIQYRVGINLGDIVIDGDDILGDGVNVASRLEGLADPGGICISGNAYEQVRDKLQTRFEELGEQHVKNIDRPVQAYRVSLASDQPEKTTDIQSGAVPLSLPDKPSIAVLPFENMSGDPEQEYFSDGITEDIITALSKFGWFFVIARNSSFAYKGQAVDIKKVGRELGVHYVLEGSVRKSGNRVRITSQLIEAETGNHLWAERYDRNLEDIFELQDEITQTISAAIEPELFSSEHDRSLRKPTEDLGAWDLFQRGVALIWRNDRPSIKSADKLIREAVDLDPNFGQAYGYLAYGALINLFLEWAEDRDATLRQGIAEAQHALAIDRRDYFAQHALGRLNTLAGNHQTAIRALETSVAINPNFALGYLGLEEAHVYGGDANRAIEYADKAIRLSPNDPMMWTMLHYKGSAYVKLRDLERAIEFFEQACQFPNVQYVAFATLAAVYVMVGREADAHKALQGARHLEPNLSITVMARMYGNSGDGPARRGRRLLDALREAGLPE